MSKRADKETDGVNIEVWLGYSFLFTIGALWATGNPLNDTDFWGVLIMAKLFFMGGRDE